MTTTPQKRSQSRRNKERAREHERKTAEALGGERLAGVGRRDVSCERVSAECKERKALPKWLTGALEQAERQARPDTLAVAVLHPLGKPYDMGLVVLRRREFMELMSGEGAE